MVAPRVALGKDCGRMSKKRAGDGDDLREALYAAPPRAFVAERRRVADALKAAARSDEARVVAKMRRPTASVWAVNQLARRAPDAIAELLAVGASLRAGERELVRGGRAEGFMAEARAARHQVAALARRAEVLLAEAGQKATATLGRKIAQTLHAASIADDDTRARLRAGRLEADLEPRSSLGASGDLSSALAASPAARPKSGTSAPTARSLPGPDRAAARRNDAAARRNDAAARRNDAAARRNDAAARRDDAAARRKAAATQRQHAAAILRARRRAHAAARKRAAGLDRAAVAADRVVSERARAVARARALVERAEAGLRAAKDALADAETAAAAAHRAAQAAAAERAD